ncbi:MAG: hypothetical protein AAF658_08120 [Myxococcota bacterium]
MAALTRDEKNDTEVAQKLERLVESNMLRLSSLICVLAFSVPVLAQQENSQFDLTVSSPPLGNPSYGGALFDHREDVSAEGVDATEFGVGVLTASSDGDRLDATGFSAQVEHRWVWGALGLRVPLAGGIVSGEALDSDFTGLGFSLSALLDVNVLAFDRGSVQVFAGYGVEGARSSFELSLQAATTDVTTFTLLHGPRIGIQGAILLTESFVFTPFYTLISVTGQTDQEVDGPGFTGFLDTIDFPRVTLTQLGADVEYVPLGISLSGIRQLGSDDSEIERVNTFTLLVSFRL